MYTSEQKEDCQLREDSLIYKLENLHFGKSMEYNELNITLPVTKNLLNNGTLYAHIFFGMASKKPMEENKCDGTMGMSHMVYRMAICVCVDG